MDVELLGVAKALSKPLNDLYELSKSGAKSKYTKWKTSKNINALYTKISTVQKVKTIWQIDKEINLKSFYYPSRLTVDDTEIAVNSIGKIPCDGNVVIQGTVGQGKSIFMRYLCSQELRYGNTIPIFLELRKIQKNETIKDHLYIILDELGFSDPTQVFTLASKTGKITLFLDGFDEVDPELVMSLISELEHFSKKYENLRIFISSRPESGIEKSAFFRILKVSPLNQNDHPGFLKKLLNNAEQENVILDAINSSQTQIKSLLTTPLMMTLLVITYKSEQTIPTQASGFYENLFQILLSRHDKTKPGYSRHRKCMELTEKQLQEIFEAFCYLTSKDSMLILSADDAYKYSKNASKFVGIPCVAEHFINDICKVACMILEDGLNFQFIHKSVQEYYCASFIKRQPEELAKVFYSSFVDKRHDTWSQVLHFCYEVDNYRLTKYFLLPHYHRLLERSCIIDNGEFKGIKDRTLSNAINAISLDFIYELKQIVGGSWSHFQDEAFRTTRLDILIFEKIKQVISTHSEDIYNLIAGLKQEVQEKQENSIIIKTNNEIASLDTKNLITKFEIHQEIKDAVSSVYFDLYERTINLETDAENIIKNTDIFSI